MRKVVLRDLLSLAGEKPIFWELVKDFLSRHAHTDATDA